MDKFLIYGANGYTGGLLAREAAARGMRPIVAGRNGAAIEALAHELGLEARVFSLANVDEIARGLREATLVLHCAGPFSKTSAAMVAACLQAKVHYLDITGEWGVFEASARRDGEAKAAGILLMPGVGFDVVPSDCLAAHLKNLLPGATRLSLGLLALTSVSRGTAKTMVEHMPEGGLIRAEGKLRRVPTAWKAREINFGSGPMLTMTIPWGDVVTAYYTTGIPDIEVYLAVPKSRLIAARLSRYFGWLLGSGFMQALLHRRIDRGPAGPTEEERRRGRTVVWGEVVDRAGKRASARLEGPDGYTLTVQAALSIAARVLAEPPPAGFHTPGGLFGADFVLTLPDVRRVDG